MTPATAVTDGAAVRYLRLFLEAAGRSEEIVVPESLEDAARRAQLFPADYFLRQVAQGVLAREAQSGRPLSSIRVEAWRADFRGSPPQSTQQRLRSFTLRLYPPFAGAH